MRHLSLLGAALVALSLSQSAAAGADSYPYSGYFSSQIVDVSAGDARLACAYSFFRQNADGSFVGYLVDKPAHDADGSVRYLLYGRGQCTIAGGRVETCTMTASADAEEIGHSYYDVIKSIQPEAIATSSFDSAQDANLYALGGIGQPTVELRFSRCEGFDDARLSGFVSDAMSGLPAEERWALQSPEFDDASRADMTAILGTIGVRP